MRPRDIAKRDKFALSHLAYAKRLAKKFYLENKSCAIEYDDLLAAAYLGLCDAAGKYQPDKGVSFKTYSFLRIRGEMFDLLRKAQPESRRQSSQLGRQLAQQEIEMPEWGWWINKEDGSPEVRVIEELGMIIRGVQGDQCIELTYLDSSGPATLAEKQIVRDHLLGIISQLPEKERNIILLKYYEDCNYAEICERTGATQKSWLSRVHKRAIDRLRKRLIAEEAAA